MAKLWQNMVKLWFALVFIWFSNDGSNLAGWTGNLYFILVVNPISICSGGALNKRVSSFKMQAHLICSNYDIKKVGLHQYWWRIYAKRNFVDNIEKYCSARFDHILAQYPIKNITKLSSITMLILLYLFQFSKQLSSHFEKSFTTLTPLFKMTCVL